GGGRQGASGFAIGSKGYVGCGTDGTNVHLDFWEYDPTDCLGVIGGNALPDSSCNDNNFCTVNDMWSDGCVCAGTFQDTDGDGICDAIDNCPSAFGTLGDPCNDGNPNTINDALNANCICAGTCTANQVTLTLNTDGNANQTSWDIVITSTSTVVCNGSGYANNSTIVVSCCLPNGCYDLRVYDSFGDGIIPGGHVLRDAANNRIIDNFGNGSTFTSTSFSTLGFCVPLGSGTLHPASCDVMTATPTTVLHANLDPAVTALYSISTPTVNANTGYQFWITNPNGGFSRRILFTHAAPGTGWPIATPTAQKASYFRLNAMSNPPTVPLGVLLNVRVRSLLNGTYGVFGPACRLYLPVPPCQLSQLTTTASPVISCAATGLSLTSLIYATPVTGATGYQFEFSKTAYLRKITSPTSSVALSFVTNPLQNNNCYNVRVRISFDGGLTFCPFGPICTITIGSAICGSAMAPQVDGNEDIAFAARMSLWPNPNDGREVHLSLSGLSSVVSIITVDVLDLTGKKVAARTLPAQGASANTVFDLGGLSQGAYVVSITAGEEHFMERMVVE
ncbi:MAG: T9SS type A sorting domain-containing protein, partial [Rhodoferax sp.]|nr:T9SS type A sorting domain-containing protein [Rhodoferax sp.]